MGRGNDRSILYSLGSKSSTLPLRNVPPHYGIYILNRLSIDNYRLLVTDDLVIELQDEYIIYQTPSGIRKSFAHR